MEFYVINDNIFIIMRVDLEIVDCKVTFCDMVIVCKLCANQ